MTCNIQAVIGSKGGVGKSAVAFYTAWALAKRGASVAVVDLDMGFRCQSTYFGVESEVVYTLGDLLRDDIIDLDRALKPCPMCKNLYLLPACTDPFTKIDFTALANVFAALRARFDFVIIDSPPSISRGYLAAISVSNNAIIVTTPDNMSLKAAALCAQIASKAGVKQQGIIINKVDVKSAQTPIINDFDRIMDEIGAGILGVVPYHQGLIYSTEAGKLPDQKADLSKAFDNIAARLCGEQVKLLIS